MHPISEILFEVYEELYRRGQIAFPLHESNRQKIDTLVKTVNANYFGVHVYRTPEERACLYLYLIIKRHPVTDGNKRMGIFWFKVYCDTRGLSPNLTNFTLDELAVAVLESENSDRDQFLEDMRQTLFESS